MAAGQGFKTFTTGEVLTAGDVNGYLMQGINVFASTAARDAAITSPQEGQFAFTKDTNGLWYYDGAAWVASGATGDIEGVTAGIGISGGGTSGTVTITNSMATAIDAKGDLVAGTGADAFSRLAVGANNTVLTADSAEATGLKWATPGGGWTLISSVTPSTSSANVSFTGISSSYRDLRVMFSARPSGSGNIQVTTNGATEYSWNLVTYSNTWTSGTRFGYFQITPTTDLVTDNAKYDITFYDSNSTTKYKSGLWTGSYRTTALGSTIALFGTFATDSSTAISSITISSTGGNWASGGTVALYGLA